MSSWWLLLRWAHWRKPLVGSQVVCTWCILRVSLVSVLAAPWLFKAAEIALFFFSWVDKPLQTSSLLPEPQVTWLLDGAECRISGLIPRNMDNPEFPILSEISSTESCTVWGTQRVLCRHEASPSLCLDLIRWNCLENCFLLHTALLSVFQSELIPVWEGLQQSGETEPALPCHSWASAHGRGALQTFGSDFCRAATAKCAPWKMCSLHSSSDWLCPFPASQFHVEFIQGASQLQKGPGRIWKWGNENQPLASFVLCVWH